MKWLRDALTGKDNLTYDAARIVGVAGAAAYVVFWTAAVFSLGHFSGADAAAYGAGLATVLLSMSGAVKLKASSEPQPADEPTTLRSHN
jgi:apolipoprotein N-acyltransferase